METFWQLGLLIISALQSISWLAGPMQAVTGLGSEAFFLLFISLLYWCVDRHLGMRVALILLFSTGLNSILKLIFIGPRPQWYDTQVKVHVDKSSFSLPSAHAQNAVAVWGKLAGQVKRRWFSYLAIELIVLIGISRIYLGVHFPTDVLIGWGIGFCVLHLFNRLSKPVAKRVQRYKLGQQLLIALGTSLLLLLPSLLIVKTRGSWQMPIAWLQVLQTRVAVIPQPLSLETPVATAGTWLGFVAGAFWLKSRRPFQPKGSVWQRGKHYAIGISIAIALWVGLDQLFPEDSTLVAYTLRYLRYALLGSWIAAGAPVMFQTIARLDAQK